MLIWNHFDGMRFVFWLGALSKSDALASVKERNDVQKAKIAKAKRKALKRMTIFNPITCFSTVNASLSPNGSKAPQREQRLFTAQNQALKVISN